MFNGRDLSVRCSPCPSAWALLVVTLNRLQARSLLVLFSCVTHRARLPVVHVTAMELKMQTYAVLGCW